MTRLFELRGLTMRYGDKEVLSDATLDLHAGEFIAIAGPNGAGKSTLLSLIAGLTAPTRGTRIFFGRNIEAWNRQAFARKVAVVRQTEPAAFPFTVAQVVSMGRAPHATSFFDTGHDRATVEQALNTAELQPFRDRDFRTLSGGEKQRVLLASALAQEPEVLLLDEPASHLDLQHQLVLHKLLRDLSRSGILVVAVTHDLNLAAAYAARIVLLDHGRIEADGEPSRVLSNELISRIFHVQVELHRTPSGQPWMIYGE